MDDLGNALAHGGDEVRMLGGGNPAHIPEVSEVLRECLGQIASDPKRCSRMLGDYDPLEGHPPFREALASMLKETFGWSLGAKNVFVGNGSQSVFFHLFNLLAGEGDFIQLPLVPEYIGYGDLGIGGNLFHASKPEIELHGERRFKYRVDFNHLKVHSHTAALCASRPTNPTGNVLTD